MPRLACFPLGAAGAFAFSGRVVPLTPVHWSGLLSTAESARLAGVKPETIRRWRWLGYLEPQGLDERGWPMHSAAAVRMAEERARESGLNSATGADPRRLRGRSRARAASPPVAPQPSGAGA